MRARWLWGAAAGPSRPPCGCPTAGASGSRGSVYSTAAARAGPWRGPWRSARSHVLTSAANRTGPFVLPSHHLLHERSQLRLPLVGEICSTNTTSAPGLAGLLRGALPPCPPRCSGRRGRGQTAAASGRPGHQRAGNTFQPRPPLKGTWCGSVRGLGPRSSAPGVWQEGAPPSSPAAPAALWTPCVGSSAALTLPPSATALGTSPDIRGERPWGLSASPLLPRLGEPRLGPPWSLWPWSPLQHPQGGMAGTDDV